MNKYELKSLLENIYTALTEEAAAPKLDINDIINPSTGRVRLGTTSDRVPPPPPPPPKPTRPMTDFINRLNAAIRRLGGALQTEQDHTNKQDLKSLLENIYTALTEQNPPPLPPRLFIPDGPTGPPPTPPDVYRNDPARDPNWNPPELGGGWYWRYRGTPPTGHWIPYPPDATPVPPKPKPTPTPAPELSSPRPRFDPVNPFRVPPFQPTGGGIPRRPTGEQRLRDALRELGIEDEIYPSLFN